MSDRIPAHTGDLRRHTARGTVLNAGFAIGFAVLGLLQRLVAAAFLTASEFGFWAVVLTILVTLAALKQLGIPDKFIQQDEPDQTVAFQKAFTLELALSVAFFLAVALVMPFYALGYDNPDLILPALVCALSVPLTAFEAPAWIPYRRLRYFRHRVITAVNPVTSFVVTVALAIAGAGYWSFVIGVLAGAFAGATVCVATSPYPIRLRFDRTTLRDYATFSLPLFGGAVSTLIVVQGALLAANHSAGLAGIGAIGLAVGISAFADRVDGIVSATLYPAVCAVVDRTSLLHEIFVKSNRVALMWGLPFGVALALFSDDLITYVFSPEWEPAIGLLAVIGLAAGVGQLAFNWTVFVRATGNTRPLLVGALVDLAAFLLLGLPIILTYGLTGWAVFVSIAVAAQLVVRRYYMRRMFPGFSMVAQFVRAAAPVVPAAAMVLLVRAATSADRTLAWALAELSLYLVVVAALTAVLERPLVREIVDYLRRRRGVAGAAPA